MEPSPQKKPRLAHQQVPSSPSTPRNLKTRKSLVQCVCCRQPLQPQSTKSLSCLHSCCTKCLPSLNNRCPVCKEDVEVSAKQWTLATKLSSLHPLAPNQKCKHCQGPATRYCSDCERYLCGTCQASHASHQLESEERILATELPRTTQSCRVHVYAKLMVAEQSGLVCCPECCSEMYFKTLDSKAAETRKRLRDLEKRVSALNKEIQQAQIERAFEELAREVEKKRQEQLELVEQRYSAPLHLQEMAKFMAEQCTDVELGYGGPQVQEALEKWILEAGELEASTLEKDCFLGANEALTAIKAISFP